MLKWTGIIAPNGKDFKTNCRIHEEGLRTSIEIIQLQGGNIDYKNFHRDDLFELIYNLVSKNSIVMIYLDAGSKDGFCQLYLPNQLSDEQVNTLRLKYNDLINVMPIFVSGIDGEFFKETVILNPGEFEINNYKQKSR